MPENTWERNQFDLPGQSEDAYEKVVSIYEKFTWERNSWKTLERDDTIVVRPWTFGGAGDLIAPRVSTVPTLLSKTLVLSSEKASFMPCLNKSFAIPL